jgi:hypothetical protein
MYGERKVEKRGVGSCPAPEGASLKEKTTVLFAAVSKGTGLLQKRRRKVGRRM